MPLFMSKIRINELARQLEVPSHAIIDMLPELGVSEKKTHSSSIDEPVAEIIRQRVQGGAGAAMRREADASVAVAEQNDDLISDIGLNRHIGDVVAIEIRG